MEHEDAESGPNPYTEDLRQFLTRITALETLYIDTSELSARGLLTIVRHTPALRKLHLERCHAWVELRVFRELSWDVAAGADVATQLLPKLTHLNLDVVALDVYEIEALLDMIRSRWWTGGRGEPAHHNSGAPSRLERVLVLSPGSSGTDYAYDVHRWDDVVRQLREEGLRMEWNLNY